MIQITSAGIPSLRHIFLIIGNVPLPVAGKIHALAALHRQRRHAVHLIPQEVRARDVVVNADLGTAQAAEILFRLMV
jgi:hypothetical protein